MRSFDAVLAAGAALLVLLTLGPVLSIPLHIPVNYNEGWNAEFDRRAVTPGSGPLYPGPDSFVFNNYPPLGFLLIGSIGRFLVGDMIEAGRIVAMLALLATGGLIGVAVHGLGGSRRAGFAAGLLMLLTTATFSRGYVAMDDPQWLAHAVGLGGLAVLLASRGASRLQAGRMGWPRIAVAAAIVVASGFIKHNLVALPLAMTVWMLRLDRRAGLIWILAGVAWVTLGLAFVWLAYGHAGFADIFHHRRVVHLRRLMLVPERLLPLLAPLVLVAARLRRRSGAAGAALVGPFVAIALVTGSLQRIGEGVSVNAHFETMIAVCLGFGLALDRVPRGRWTGPAIASLFAASPVIVAAVWHVPSAWRDIVDRFDRAAAYRPIVARLAAARGPVACEMMSLCTWAGRPSSVDMFNLTQSVLAGGGTAAFRAAAAHGAFALVEVQPGSNLHRDAVREAGYDPILAALAGRYVEVLEDPPGMVLLVPKPRPDPRPD